MGQAKNSNARRSSRTRDTSRLVPRHFGGTRVFQPSHKMQQVKAGLSSAACVAIGVWRCTNHDTMSAKIDCNRSFLIRTLYGNIDTPPFCCGSIRSLGDWVGLAHAYAAKGRLHMCTGHTAEAVEDFETALKVRLFVI